MNVGLYSFEEYVHLVKSFHGSVAPGMIMGGTMVNLGLYHIPKDTIYDVICETSFCLPDAVQLLTPCTIGNGWLKIIELGRYAVTLYDKYSGKGVRIFLDPVKMDDFDAIKDWFFKRKPKHEQDTPALFRQLQEAEAKILSAQEVTVKSQYLEKRSKGSAISVCPLCGEAYPARDGEICIVCREKNPYAEQSLIEDQDYGQIPFLRSIPVEEAVGRESLHDMTRIIPQEVKGPAFKHNQMIQAEDIDTLRKMGKENLYIRETERDNEGWLHEDEVAQAFADAMAGEGVTFNRKPSEGKINLLAERDGLLIVESGRLGMFNLVPNVMCASRQSYSVVKKDSVVAGTRAIPLYLSKKDFSRAMEVLREQPLFRILPMRKAIVGILVTGTEVSKGLVEDRFFPLIKRKMEKLGCDTFQSFIVPDDRNAIAEGTKKLLNTGIDLLITTGGLSVDPDDVTRQGIIDAGATDILYGAAVLPGAMTLLAKIGTVQVIGVPAGALYFEATCFDILIPRLLAGISVSRHDLARLGHGGLCLNCERCIYPFCPFGK